MGYPNDKCTRRGHQAMRPIWVTYWVQFVKDNQDMRSGRDKWYQSPGIRYPWGRNVI
ncbi:unnamed protein product [Prunus armeniaca]